ncbi:MAG TPA: DPP IV N-terminal domain-containing protein [Candidatus Acidoferrum sp.]|nr:DPP IV N-terminal domain-containing protein [Candidatus Acidoferrum sp.]
MPLQRLTRRTTLLALLVCLGGMDNLAVAQQRPASAAQPGELTIDRIYGQPSLSGRLTRSIAWSPDGKRLTFLDTKGTGKDARTELWALDTSSGERALLISAEKLENIFPASPTKQSQATGAGRHAPAQYQWAPSGDALLFEGTNALAWFDLKTQSGRVLVSGKEELNDVKISPDSKYVSFIRDHNLWLVSTADGKERAFTTGGTEKIRKGELDWVYPEELELYTAYWWAPDSSAIAYLEMDETKVTQFALVNFESYSGEAELQRYPVAGGVNPVVRVFVGNVNGGEPRLMDIGANTDMYTPRSDTDIYIPRVNWLPDSRGLSIQRLNRDQNVLELLLADAATGKSSTLLTEKDQYWVNVSDDLHFLKDGKRFVWSSERTGYRHLYLYGLDGKQIAQLTKGDWEVNHVDGLDEAKGIIYFTSTEKSPIERHLYRVSLDGSGFARITKEDGMHTVNLSPTANVYVDTYSNAMTPPRQDLFRTDGTKASTLNENKVNELEQYHLSPVEFSTVKSHDGVPLNCFLIKPPHFDPAKKYPVIVYTYGGPHAQVVLNAWAGSGLLWHEMMAQKGYIIFALDNRGSAGRGHVFEEPIQYRFGGPELSDQRDGVAWLQQQPWVDPQRIGIWGWSYGGHMTLHAMFEAGDLFKVGFAGGPVTEWHYYDSIYTERYMGLPQQHESGYKESSPLTHTENFKGKLLIAQGTGDDNVHYSNTLALINDLISRGKYVEVIAAPGRGHGVSDPPARKIVWGRVTQFFLDNL